MFDPHVFALYCVAALALIVVPGPAVLYIVGESVHGGRRAGLSAAGGVAAGGLVHIAAAVVGLSAIIVASAEAFTAVKLAGAAYLVFLGLSTLLHRRNGAPDEVASGRRSLASSFRRGAVVNTLNPKTALFFLAFLPQFVDPNGPVRLQLALLGCTFVLLALVSDSAWALAAGTAGTWLRGHRGYRAVRKWVSGSVFLGLGVATAVSGPHRAN